MKGNKGNGSVFQRGAVWWVKYYRNGKAYRESSGSDKESDARKLLRKRQGEIALDRFIGPESERVTVRDLSEAFLNDYRVNQKKSLARASRSLTHILPYFGDYKAHQVRTDSVKNYIAHRLEQSAANATINRELSALKRMYTLECKRRESNAGRIFQCWKSTMSGKDFLSAVSLSPFAMPCRII